MAPLPKRKLSKGKRGRRRSHDAIGIPKLVECSQCHQMTMPHRVWYPLRLTTAATSVIKLAMPPSLREETTWRDDKLTGYKIDRMTLYFPPVILSPCHLVESTQASPKLNQCYDRFGFI